MITIEVFKVGDDQRCESNDSDGPQANEGSQVVGEVRLVGWSLDKRPEQAVLIKENETSVEAEQELLKVAESIESEFLNYYEHSSVIPLGGNLEKFYWMLKDE